jgi:hypothetical protein
MIRLMKSQILRILGSGPGRWSRPVGIAATAAFVIGGLLVVWSAYIHFHLWDEAQGYRHISIIGPLFLLQAIGGLVVGVLVIAVRRVWAALAGIGFAASTIVGFLLTVGLTDGLFNFKETWAAPFAHQAFAIEIAIVVVLLVAGALCLIGSASTTRSGTAPTESALSGA